MFWRLSPVGNNYLPRLTALSSLSLPFKYSQKELSVPSDSIFISLWLLAQKVVYGTSMFFSSLFCRISRIQSFHGFAVCSKMAYYNTKLWLLPSRTIKKWSDKSYVLIAADFFWLSSTKLPSMTVDVLSFSFV
jgi:hypothetical protein